MWNKITIWWSKLPHPVQAAITAFGSGVVGVAKPLLEQWSSGQAFCTTHACLMNDLNSAIHAGVIGVVALYIPVNTKPKELK